MEADRPQGGPSAAAPRERRFLLTFATIAGVALGAYFFPYERVGLRCDRFFLAYLSGYARATGAVLRLFDPAVTVHGPTIAGRFGMQIVRSCDAMEANILFVAAALAFPAAARRKAAAVAAGLAALVACNVARLCCLYFVGVYAPASFDAAHYEVWPLLMVGLATLDFLVCARWMSRGPVRSLPSESAGV